MSGQNRPNSKPPSAISSSNNSPNSTTPPSSTPTTPNLCRFPSCSNHAARVVRTGKFTLNNLKSAHNAPHGEIDMKKLKLNLDDLQIDSFITTPELPAARGTVYGHISENDACPSARGCTNPSIRTCPTDADTCNIDQCGISAVIGNCSVAFCLTQNQPSCVGANTCEQHTCAGTCHDTCLGTCGGQATCFQSCDGSCFACF